MNKSAWLVAALVWPVAVSAQSNADRIASGVYRWSDLRVESAAAETVRPIFEGRTRDLAYLRVRAVTLPTGGAANAADVDPALESFVIVKEGRLAVTARGATSAVGPGSVALFTPRDPHSLANVGSAPVTYYEFSYRSNASVDAARGDSAGGSQVVNWDDLEFRPSETGGRRQPFDRATAMLRRLEMHVTTLNPGLDSHAPHTHRAAEMVLMLKGDATMVIGDEHPPATGGDLIFLASESSHALDNTGTVPAEYFAFQWQ